MNPENNHFDDTNVKPYKASANLNVLLSNPQYQSGNTVGNNMNQSSVNNTMGAGTYQMPKSQDIPTLEPQPVKVPTQPSPNQNTSVSDETLDVTEKAYPSSNMEEMHTIKNTTYVSNTAMAPKKEKKTFKVSKDTAVIIIMLLVIFIFIMLLPQLSNWIREIRY